MREYISAILIGIIILLFAASCGVFFSQSIDCNRAGGQMVKTMTGLYKCIKIQEINP